MTSELTVQKTDPSLLLLTNAAFITLFLFFIDEGYYNFNWMTNWGAWLVFSIYTIVLFLIQVGISKLIEIKVQSAKKVALGIISTTSLGILLLSILLAI
ncbi:hypothetical protein KFE94_01450 [bacterium SCSIO 12643]|nr:hypothetical protein KFE94_01450 [bacterium SCSIO 12643]